MKSLVKVLSVMGLAVAAIFSIGAASADTNLVGVQGYDLVSYHQDSGPVKGNGNFSADHNGVTYLFSSLENKEKFAAAPANYVPEFGGYCAYGVKFGKKFAGDPERWKVVDGKLYLNLDEKVQALWAKDIPTYIQEANKQWMSIENVPASDL